MTRLPATHPGISDNAVAIAGDCRQIDRLVEWLEQPLRKRVC
jgi:hypothetical protein